MKSIKLSLILLAISMSTNAQNVYIPDVNFKTALLNDNTINTNGDGEIQVSEASAVSGTLDVGNLSIADLTGIEAFTEINTLYCHNNSDLSNLDLSFNISLVELLCSNHGMAGGGLITLDISKNVNLEALNCRSNLLTSLDVSNNPNLIELICYNNPIFNLDVSSNTKLQRLHCLNNSLSSLDVTNNLDLIVLEISDNSISSIDVTKNTKLIGLGFTNNLIEDIDISNNTEMIELSCDGNLLTSLDVSNNTLLTDLRCHLNDLSSLDVSNSPLLEILYCDNNSLASLNVKNGTNSVLVSFRADNNPKLSCISVDNASWADANWSSGKDSWVEFNNNCSLGIEDRSAISYNGNILLAEGEGYISVYSLTGRKIYGSKLKGKRNIPLKKGFYIVRIVSEKGTMSKKIYVTD